VAGWVPFSALFGYYLPTSPTCVILCHCISSPVILAVSPGPLHGAVLFLSLSAYYTLLLPCLRSHAIFPATCYLTHCHAHACLPPCTPSSAIPTVCMSLACCTLPATAYYSIPTFLLPADL